MALPSGPVNYYWDHLERNGMRLSRRQIITGNTSGSCHIASMVVQCLPEKLDATSAALSAIDGLEVPERNEKGKLVVLIEVVGEANLMSRISEIQSTPGVISANLAYHQIDED
jgi:nitrate reductase NapAB chaperone NapD